MNGAAREETEAQRLDRNLTELIQELRVAQTGVQVLFAFLLTVPFSGRFEALTAFQRGSYFTALMGALIAALLLIAPTPLHRMLFRRGERHFLVKVSNRLTIAGLAFVAISMTAAILLVGDLMFDGALAIIPAAFAGVAFAGVWYGIPLSRRLSRRRDAA